MLPQNLYLFLDHVVYLPDAKVDVHFIKNSEETSIKISRATMQDIFSDSSTHEVSYDYLCSILFLLIGSYYVDAEIVLKGITLSDVDKINSCPHENYRRNLQVG